MWSRLGAGSVTEVVPSASSPASRTQDLTCALATGRSWWTPCRRAPWTVKGGRCPPVASITAPMAASGPAMRSTGRRRIELSPSSVKRRPSWPASHPGSSRMSVPALPTSMGPSGWSAPRRPAPRRTTSSPRCSAIAPTARTAPRVERVSAASRNPRTRTGSSHIAPSRAARWLIDLSGGGVSSPRRRLAGGTKAEVTSAPGRARAGRRARRPRPPARQGPTARPRPWWRPVRARAPGPRCSRRRGPA